MSTFEWNEVIQQLYGKDNEEMSLESQTKQTEGHFEVMFTWKDYEKNSSCFIGNNKVSVAGIIYKNNVVEDYTTGKRFKLKSETLDEQKKEAEKILLEYWNDVIEVFSKFIYKVKNTYD